MRFLLSLLLALVAPLTILAAPERYAKDIDQLTANDATHAPAPGGTVFVGSSSIRLWRSLAEDFPDAGAINRGFGGSQLADTVHYADRIILPYRPRAVVVYAGENDLWSNKTPEEILQDFQELRAKLHAALPETRLIFLSVKLSPSRARVHDAVRRTNQLIAEACAQDPRCTFVDVATPLLGPDGVGREEYFVKDRLHLSPAGYAIWTKTLAPHLKR